MALTHTFQVGTTQLSKAFIRIDRVIVPRKGSDGERLVEAVTAIHEAEDAEPLERRGYYFNLDMNGENPIKQAYEHLKTLPEFADAVDC
jgi:hypothetical protein